MGKLKRHHKPWTPEEDDYLLKYVGHKTYDQMAKHLNRTPVAIEGRINTLGIKNKHIETNTFTASEIGRVLGKSHETIRRWINSYGLKAEQKNTSYEGNNFNRYYIKPEDVWGFVEENKHLIDFTKIQRGILLPEPHWLREEILKAFDGRQCKRGKPWTDQEREMALGMYYSGANFNDISKELGRSVKGVEKQIYKLINQNLPVTAS